MLSAFLYLNKISILSIFVFFLNQNHFLFRRRRKSVHNLSLLKFLYLIFIFKLFKPCYRKYGSASTLPYTALIYFENIYRLHLRKKYSTITPNKQNQMVQALTHYSCWEHDNFTVYFPTVLYFRKYSSKSSLKIEEHCSIFKA